MIVESLFRFVVNNSQATLYFELETLKRSTNVYFQYSKLEMSSFECHKNDQWIMPPNTQFALTLDDISWQKIEPKVSSMSMISCEF